MENASEALIIGGTILIAIIILSIGVYLFVNYVRVGESYEETQVTAEITKFNTNFTVFDGRTDITIQEIVSLISFTKNYNKQNETNVEVMIKNVRGIDSGANLADKNKYTDTDINNIVDIIQKNSTETKPTPTGYKTEIIKFSCESVSTDGDGRVNKIIFKK